MRKGTKGVAGFFADIPALLAIIIGLWLFTFSLYHTHSRYIEDVKSETMHGDLEDFVRIVRDNNMITRSPGVLCGEKLDSLNNSMFVEQLDPVDLGHNYMVEIEDDSGYPTVYSATISSSPLPEDRDVYSRRTSVVIAEPEGKMHLSTVYVSIWGLT